MKKGTVLFFQLHNTAKKKKKIKKNILLNEKQKTPCKNWQAMNWTHWWHCGVAVSIYTKQQSAPFAIVTAAHCKRMLNHNKTKETLHRTQYITVGHFKQSITSISLNLITDSKLVVSQEASSLQLCCSKKISSPLQAVKALWCCGCLYLVKARSQTE